MNSAKREKRNTNGRRFATAIVCSAILLLLNAVGWAQVKITAAPDPFDPAKSKVIVLSLTNNDGTLPDPNLGLIDSITSVTVGEKAVTFQADKTKGIVTIADPPSTLAGPQMIKLVSNKSLVGEVQLSYPGAGGPDDLAREQAESEIKRRNEVAHFWWYTPAIVIGFTLFLGLFIWTISKSILFSRATFRNPLGLPVGSFRAILAYTLVGYVGFYVLTSLLTISEFKPPEFLLGIVATVVGFYFGSRSSEEGLSDEKSGIVRGIVRRDAPTGGTPVSGASVKFKRPDGAEPYSRLTDVDGRFVLQGVKADKYKVVATADAGSGQLEQLTITEGSDQEIQIVIKSTGGGGDPVTVGSVKGKVTQPDGTGVGGATITLKGDKTFTGLSVADGSYTIDKVDAGQYTADAASPNFESSKPLSINVIAGKTSQLDMKLEPKT